MEADESGSKAVASNPSRISLRALDGLNFFLADVRDGMGPFLGTFLRENQGWDAGRVGIALAASQLGTVLAQTPSGALIDRTRRKRSAVAIAAAVVALGCVMLDLVPYLAAVIACVGLAFFGLTMPETLTQGELPGLDRNSTDNNLISVSSRGGA